jgi:hypothetical protein
MKKLILIASLLFATHRLQAQSMEDLFKLSNAKTRSISPENITGEKGKGGMAKTGTASESARDLGIGWKINPYVVLDAGKTTTIADITGSGQLNHIWMTLRGNWRYSILRIYWDDETEPSVEVPVGDFFAVGCGSYAPILSLPVCVNPGSGLNCYWPMPYRKKCKITMENLDATSVKLFYQVDYELKDIPKDAGYFHAQFRRVNPLPYKSVYTLVDSIAGKGQYVGTYMNWGVHSNSWWGEGEIKFYMDGDTKYPTINGTGTEDYFGGSYNFHSDVKQPDGRLKNDYAEFSTPYSGLQIVRGDGNYLVTQRFGMYRWHITDPIRFDTNLKVTIQALGWRDGHRYLPLQDDISSVV